MFLSSFLFSLRKGKKKEENKKLPRWLDGGKNSSETEGSGGGDRNSNQSLSGTFLTSVKLVFIPKEK